MPFEKGIHADALPLKGVLYGQVQISDKKCIHIFVTHTQATYTYDPIQSFPSRISRAV